MHEVFFDHLFRKKRKSGTYKVVDAPTFDVSLADSHAHVHMLDNPALALARAAVHGISFIEVITDPAEDASFSFERLAAWEDEARELIKTISSAPEDDHGATPALPHIRVACGVHPHNAKDFDTRVEQLLLDSLHNVQVSALGEIGLDYHYDFSPRDIQKNVFASQLALAVEAGLPVSLHIREAFDDAYDIMSDVGFPEAGTILHCYTSDAHEIAHWVDAGCYIAFGGALTFANSDDIREASKLVPVERLLIETDSPYMAPVPLRGETCEPAHALFTAFALCELLGYDDPSMLLWQVYENTLALLDRPPTPWQEEAGHA